MINDFFKRLRSRRAEEPLPALDAQLAVGALLVRLAKADQHYAVEEIARIDALLGRDQGLNPVEAAKARATCEKLEAQAPDTADFTAMVQANVDHAERARLLDGLWQVSLADRVLKPEEEAFLGDVATALGIDADRAEEIRQHHNGIG
ncbi:TerB family tellurite resistance protein [Aliiroseovarius subalbicans]|uniref:tellurite resistance TerB family protein n=1 Tax=Aliiroseovarius subalbicans TaxID=2925840 RepID=UPI001F58C7DE|nr:TerB family tellurite resistance protein [Aliiroseovarius subalbicans]MCI2397904.1 TerB family tellurite resistance protein [Aliiroseovarius subalbicans]